MHQTVFSHSILLSAHTSKKQIYLEHNPHIMSASRCWKSKKMHTTLTLQTSNTRIKCEWTFCQQSCFDAHMMPFLNGGLDHLHPIQVTDRVNKVNGDESNPPAYKSFLKAQASMINPLLFWGESWYKRQQTYHDVHGSTYLREDANIVITA